MCLCFYDFILFQGTVDRKHCRLGLYKTRNSFIFFLKKKKQKKKSTAASMYIVFFVIFFFLFLAEISSLYNH